MEYQVEECMVEHIEVYRDWLLKKIAEGWELVSALPVRHLARCPNNPWAFYDYPFVVHIFRRPKPQ